MAEACEEVEQLEGSALLTYLKGTISLKEYAVAVPDPPAYLDTYLSRDQKLEYVWALPSVIQYPGWGRTICAASRRSPIPDRRPRACSTSWIRCPWNTGRRSAGCPYRGRRAIRAAQSAGGFALGPAPPGNEYAHRASGHDASTRRQQFSGGIELGLWASGHPTQTIVVWDEQVDAVRAKAEVVEATLNNAGFTAKVEGLNTLPAWNGTLPGNRTANRATAALTTQNLAHLVPATSHARGPSWNTHLDGPPLMMTTGAGRRRLPWILHEDDVGRYVYRRTDRGLGSRHSLACWHCNGSNIREHRSTLWIKTRVCAVQPMQ